MNTFKEKLNSKKKTTNGTRRIFNHKPASFGYSDLITESISGRRYYSTPDGSKYPSITTVLGSLSKDSIEEWKRRVGEEEANRISKIATERGLQVHGIIEKYLMNEENYFENSSLIAQTNFNSVKSIIDKCIGDIYGIEIPLYSDYLKVAGRCDCIAEWDGVLSIIDWKTSKRIKSKEDITSYFLQKSAYAIMFEERTRQPIVNLVTVMTVDDEKPLIFKEHRDNWDTMLVEIIRKYSSDLNSLSSPS